jgi:cyclopropane-fatty-acyl-phospholipid synthase
VGRPDRLNQKFFHLTDSAVVIGILSRARSSSLHLQFTADRISAVLEPGGRAGLQIITIQDALFEEYNARTDFIQKYIFPGGMLPSEGRLQPVVEQAALRWDTVERFGQDYADTLKLWDERFQAAWGDIRRMGGFDERFRRLWRFYLAYCEAGFRSARTDVIQLALTRA